MYFVGGEGKGVNPPDTPAEKRSETVAADPRLYDSYREGEFSYRVPVPEGSVPVPGRPGESRSNPSATTQSASPQGPGQKYRVIARFTEPTATKRGERVFDVDVNGKTVLHKFDIFAAAGGKLKGVERSFDGTAKDGFLVITFHPSRGEALVSSLSIAPLEPH
jgi:beta-galactosidase